MSISKKIELFKNFILLWSSEGKLAKLRSSRRKSRPFGRISDRFVTAPNLHCKILTVNLTVSYGQSCSTVHSQPTSDYFFRRRLKILNFGKYLAITKYYLKIRK